MTATAQELAVTGTIGAWIGWGVWMYTIRRLRRERPMPNASQERLMRELARYE